MQQLKELLETAVSHTKFDLGQVEHRSNGSRTSYAERPGEVIEAGEFRKIVVANNWNDEFISAQRARPTMSKELHSQLEKVLNDLLCEYIDSESGKIGHAFPVNGRGSYSYESNEGGGLKRSAFVSKVGDVAYALIRGAAILGAERVSDLVSGWVQGKPVEYRSCSLISGLYIDEHLVPMDGVYISPLPRSRNKLTGDLPRAGGLSKRDYIGRTVASLSTFAEPAFLNPKDVYGGNGTKIATVSGLGFPQLCKALSLVENSHVEPGFFWNDYLELSALWLSSSQSIWSTSNSGYSRSLPNGTSRRFDFETDEETVVLPKESISNFDPKELWDTIEAVAGVNSRELNLAIERWWRSKRSMSNLNDSLVDLRIALEALYLKGFTSKYSQEMRFRLALHGAWYLGTNFNERQVIWETLRKAYDSASGVVHGRELKGDQESQEV